jgi:Family of unknown function (DUF6317)
MSAGYGVILDDLADMAGKFTTESGEVGKLGADLDHKGVSTGDGELDGMLAAALTTLQGLQKGLTKKLKEHGTSLQACHDGYHKTDADHARLLDTLMEAAEKKEPK